MVNWYVKGQSQYTEGDFHMGFYIDIDGYDESNYDDQDIEGEGEINDPFMTFGIDTETWVYGQGQVEIGLLGSHRIRINSSGVRIWTDGDVWEDPLGGGGSVKGQLQGHIVPLVGCVWGVNGIAMNDSGDSAMCTFDLTVNVDTSEDIKIVLVYGPTWSNQCAIHIHMGFQRTNGSEALAWNYLNDSTVFFSTGSADFGYRMHTWTIPAAVFDTNDTVTIYWFNSNAYDYYAHSMYLLYTEAT